MAKNIVVCLDGTWNHPDQTADGQPADTNVYKLYKSLVTSSNQLPFYDDGVGVDGTAFERLAGGAIGDGLFGKIKDGYTKIAHSYQDGDQIFIFGFSRGAYTARSLAGMVAVCGLPDPDKFVDQTTEDAFDAYRAGTNRRALLEALGAKYGNRIGGTAGNIDIAVVGVWDTVGALGIPGDIFQGFNAQFYGFLDTSLHPDVKAAYHAVSINERRFEFPATLWTSAPAPGQTIDQQWFAGNHGDVGGGWPDSGLSDLTLGWMMERAQSQGVLIDPAMYQRYTTLDPKLALGPIHDAWTVVWGPPATRPIPPGAVISTHVVARWQGDTTYRPSNLPPNFPTP
ncbi:MAG TPA: DUF2235 domain-containing protein [Aliidongia sp.]|uniref:DUF2235 domain-containing protein n=1 Tax=Aliidongia sp. TaxID=1914230 RepID=UPI002DDCCE23|nr:DUF2235 domain-containing protein [Aliidongia sp.]HEV2676028.1 DUF2235 domain-containing protein [Aliidongia sp.]